MQPALRAGDVVLTRPAALGVRPGDVVVLRHTEPGTKDRLVTHNRYIKRVLAAAGQVVTMEAGRLSVDGHAEREGRAPRGAFRQIWTVPEGHLFVVGDNAAASTDSRVWRHPFVPCGDLEGVVIRRRAGRGNRRRGA